MSATQAPTARLPEFDALRAVAIVLVVLAHSVVARPQFPALLRNMIAGGTCVFVFISGFFYRQVFFGKLSPTAFWLRRARALVPPFLFMSLVGLALDLAGRYQRFEDPWPSFWESARDSALRGYVLHPHWYVPFALLLFSFAPLYARFVRLTLGRKLGFIALVSVVGSLAHRPLHHGPFWVIAGHSLLYFLPFYLLGILVAEHRAALQKARGPLPWLMGAWWLAALLLQTFASDHPGNSHKALWEFRGLDLILIQKLPQCMLLLFVCERWTRQQLAPWAKRLSEASFAVFFLHSLVCDELVRRATLMSTHPIWTVPATVAVTVFATFTSLAVATALRRYTTASRWLIGW